MIDIVIGSVIGVVGTVLIFKRASSLRLPYLLGDVIRKEGQLLEMLSTEQDEERIKRERNKLQGELVNLRALYDNVIGEYSKNGRQARRIVACSCRYTAVRLYAFLRRLKDMSCQKRRNESLRNICSASCSS